ncbi:MAG: amidohydrolase family protein [Blastocatellia bacterium]
MTQLLITNARVFDGANEECPEGMQVLIEGGLIREVSEKAISAPDAQVIDAGGRTLIPGLIDCHVHAYASDVDVQKIENAGSAYRTAHAARMLGHALDCGFTTVRDVGGGDYSLSRAIADGLIRGPRFLYSGRFLSMTGGHGDFRQLHDQDDGLCACGPANSFGIIADGIDQVIRAAREELRRGAHCIKIMGSGGVASPTDPIWMNQYREDEIRAIVNETNERRSYTTAHCHPASAVRRCTEAGVRGIEHGTLIDDETAVFVAKTGNFIIPTMVVIFALLELGKQLGFPAVSQKKVEIAYAQALTGLDSMMRAGVKVVYGTDLLGKLYVQQCREFTIRREVFSPVELLRQATSTAAELLMMEGQIGCIAPGAFADILVVDGDPLTDIGVLAADGMNLRLIVRSGEIVKNQLT